MPPGSQEQASYQKTHQSVGKHEADRGHRLYADPPYGGGKPQYGEHRDEQRHAVGYVVVVESSRVPREDHPRPPHGHEESEETQHPTQVRLVVQSARQGRNRHDEAQVEEELQPGRGSLLSALLVRQVAQHLRTHKSLRKLLLARLRRPCAIDQHRRPPAGNVRPTLLSALWSRIAQMASFQPWCRSPLLNSCERRCGVMTDASEVRETRDLERRNHELSVLNEIARELNRSVELGEALGFTLSQVAELLGLR